MPVPSSINDLSTTPGSNSPAGTESPSTADDYFRAHAAFIASLRDTKASSSDLAAASGASSVGYLPAGTGAVATNVQSKLREFVSVLDFGAVLDGVTNDAASLFNANAAAAAAKVPLLIPGVLHVGTPTTITVPVVDTLNQIFSATSQVTIDNKLYVRPEWFGAAAGNIRLAVNALPSDGGVVQLSDAVYPPSYNTATGSGDVPGVDYLAKANVFISGAVLPKFKADSTGLEGGTIIKGMFAVFADGFKLDKVGFDSGSAACTELNGGTAMECFLFFQPNKVTPLAQRQFVSIGDIIAIGKDPTAAIHPVLLEGITQGTVKSTQTLYGIYGTVIKSAKMQVGKIKGTGHTHSTCLIKAHDYVYTSYVQVGEVYSESSTGSVENGAALFIEGLGTAGDPNGVIYGTQVGQVLAYYKDRAVLVNATTSAIANTQIGEVNAFSCTAAVEQVTSISDGIRRFSVNSLISDSCTTGVAVGANVDDELNHFASVQINNATTGFSVSGKVSFGHANFAGVSGTCLLYSNTSARIMVGTYTATSSPTLWNLKPALSNSWANTGGGDSTYDLFPMAGRVYLKGVINSGTNASIIATGNLPANIRPSESLQMPCINYHTGAYQPGAIAVGPAGQVNINPYVAGAVVGMDGVSWPIPY